MVRGSGCTAPRAWFRRRLTRSLAQAPLPRQAGHLPIFLALLRRPLSGHRAQGGPPPPLPRSTRTCGRPRIFGGRRHCRPLAAARRRRPPPRRRRRRRVGSCAGKGRGNEPTRTLRHLPPPRVLCHRPRPPSSARRRTWVRWQRRRRRTPGRRTRPRRAQRPPPPPLPAVAPPNAATRGRTRVDTTRSSAPACGRWRAPTAPPCSRQSWGS